MNMCYYLRYFFTRNKLVDNDLHYNILDDNKQVITIYCPQCGYKINSYK